MKKDQLKDNYHGSIFEVYADFENNTHAAVKAVTDLTVPINDLLLSLENMDMRNRQLHQMTGVFALDVFDASRSRRRLTKKAKKLLDQQRQ